MGLLLVPIPSPDDRLALWRVELDPRCALRQQLAAVGGCAPSAPVLTTGRHGKPEWPGSGWHFNLAHSQGLMLLVLSREGPVGIDVERITEPLTDLAGLAQQVMTSREHAGWSGLPTEQRLAAFLRAWTRKEACLKAWGLGLHLEPHQLQVGFSVDSASQPAIVQPPAGVPGLSLLRYDLSLADNAEAQAAVALGSVA
jgi:phosphopantetheine--protein transferase-like protein